MYSKWLLLKQRYCMKLLLIILLLCLPLCYAGAEETSIDPLVGLWEFERVDSSNTVFSSYTEFTEDGFYIFQHIDESGSVILWNIDSYSVKDGILTYGSGQSNSYILSNDSLALVRENGWGDTWTDTFHRIVERPTALLDFYFVGDYCYTKDEEDGAAVMKYLGSAGADDQVSVPGILNGLSVTSIGGSAFSECRVGSVVLPDSVRTINAYAFENAKIQQVTIPNGITEIGALAFYESELDAITIPGSVRSIEDYAFRYCRGLKEVRLSEGLVQIGKSAFNGCEQITTITLPDSLMILKDNPFSNCQSLTDIHISDEHPNFVIKDGILFSRDGQQLICCPSGLKTERFVIPEGTSIITSGAFSGCQYLENVELPASVTKIGAFAFSDCRHLTDVKLPASVNEIGAYAFSDCWNLKEIAIPAGVTELSDNVFYYDLSLKQVILPDGLTKIGHYAFWHCMSLTNIRIPSSVTWIGTGAFRDCNSKLTLTMPAGSYAEQYCVEEGIPYKTVKEQ